MKIVVYKASEPYLDGGSIDIISTNIGAFKKQVLLASNMTIYTNLKSGEKVSEIADLEDALNKYKVLQKIKNKKSFKWQ